MMLLLVAVFAVLLCVSFGVAFLTLRRPSEQRQVEARLQQITPALFLHGGGQGTESLLPARETAGGAPAWLQRFHMVAALERLVYQSRGHHNVGPTLAAMVSISLVSFLGMHAVGAPLPVAALLCVALGSAPVVRLSQLRTKRVKTFEAALPDAIDLCTRALHAGHSLIAAFGVVAEQGPDPVRGEFAEIFKKHNFGLPLRDALMETLERIPSGDLRVLITGVLVQKDTGGNLTEIFERMVQVIRERLRIAGEIRTHTAQGRMTAWILTLLPPALLVIINVLDPGYSLPLFQDPTGQKVMYTGAALLVVGGFVVRRIVQGIEV